MTFKELEAIRETLRTKIIRYSTITVLISMAISFFFTSINGAWLFFAVLGGGVITLFLIKDVILQYRSAYKAYFVGSTLKTAFTNLSYNHNEGFSSSYIQSVGLLKIGDGFTSNDLVIAKYKDVGFYQADIRTQEQRNDSKYKSRHNAAFIGRYLVYEFERDFNFNLILAGRRFYTLGDGGLARKQRKYQKIETESTEFNEYFRIFAQDGFETFYLLDPATIERLQQLCKYYNYDIAIGFIDKNLHIAINNDRDSFEPPLPFKPINEQMEFEKVSADIKIITDIVDALRLDKNIFKK